MFTRTRWRIPGIRVAAVLSAAVLGSVLAADRVLPKGEPRFTSVPVTVAMVGERYAYRVTTADPDARERRVVTLVEAPAWLRLRRAGNGSAVLRGRPGPGDLGSRPVTLRVTDAAGSTAVQRFDLGVFRGQAATPVLDPSGGTGLAAQVMVSMVTSTPGATIRYTIDGTVPTAATGLVYHSPVMVAEEATLTAVAVAPQYLSSAPVAATYTFLLLPRVETLGLSAADVGEATVTGTVDPRGMDATTWFEWWNEASGLRGQTDPTPVGAGTGPTPISAPLSGLSGATLYYYQGVAANANGEARGEPQSLVLEPLDPQSLTVNTTEDTLTPPPGKLTLREAVGRVDSGAAITFDPLLDGQTIQLTIVGEPASLLKGEVFAMNAGRWEFRGFQERNYGASALYAAKDLTLDAAALPLGITLRWAGGEALPARVLAVLGDVTLRNVALTSGRVVATALAGNAAQPFTLARGAGLAVWGTATLEHCVVAGNQAVGDTSPSRDRGAFGGGIYADCVQVTDCVVSGNRVVGFGAAGGGIYSVSGTEAWEDARIDRSAVTGNRVTAQHAYGGGVYSDGGGPGNLRPMHIANSTLARNLVEDHPGLAESAMMQYYYRGGGVYMSNGYLLLSGSTIAENRVTGNLAQFSGKPNMGGGGIGATIGNAHVVESMEVWHCVLVGNEVGGVPNDLFTGSLVEFYSDGYNLVGVIDFSQILVPIPAWEYLSRRHWPKTGDREGVGVGDVLNLPGVRTLDTVVSAGTDAGEAAVLCYPPQGLAVDRMPSRDYYVDVVRAGYSLVSGAAHDDFLNLILDKLRHDYSRELGPDFGTEFGDLTDVVWGGEPATWPSDPQNAPWITFWHNLDAAIGDRLGAVRLGDDFWGTFRTGAFGANLWVTTGATRTGPVRRDPQDQLGNSRLADRQGDIGAVELQP